MRTYAFPARPRPQVLQVSNIGNVNWSARGQLLGEQRRCRVNIRSPSRRHESSYIYRFLRRVSQYFLHEFPTSLHRFRLDYDFRRILRPVLWYFDSCSSKSGISGQTGCPRLRQIFLGSRISGTGIAGRTCGRAHRISLRKRFFGSRISETGLAGLTRVQAHPPSLGKMFLG